MPLVAPQRRRLHIRHKALWSLTLIIVAVIVLSMPVPVARLQASNADTGENPSADEIQASQQVVVPPENTLNIPKLNMRVPVIYDSAPDEESFQKSLERGVVHYTGTARPGQPGNVVMFGHSSNDWWEPGDYKFVFVLLSRMKVDDIIGVDYNGKRHYYVVTNIKVVDPTAIEVLYPTQVPTLTLITCTPPGTSLKRLIVQAREAKSSTNSGSIAAEAPPEITQETPTEAQSPETIIGTSTYATTMRNLVVGLIEKFVPLEE